MDANHKARKSIQANNNNKSKSIASTNYALPIVNSNGCRYKGNHGFFPSWVGGTCKTYKAIPSISRLLKCPGHIASKKTTYDFTEAITSERIRKGTINNTSRMHLNR